MSATDKRGSKFYTLDRIVDRSPGLKVFISSRPDEDIKYRFGVGPNLDIKATDNQKDIERVVNERLCSSPQHWQRHISPALKAEIHGTLIDKSEGMCVDIDCFLKGIPLTDIVAGFNG